MREQALVLRIDVDVGVARGERVIERLHSIGLPRRHLLPRSRATATSGPSIGIMRLQIASRRRIAAEDQVLAPVALVG